MIDALFWFCAVGATYSYFLYPVVLRCLPVRRRVALGAAPLADGDLPPLTLIITAHNEQARIERKLANTRALDYPRDRLQVIVASDASTDATDEIVQRHAAEGVQLVRPAERLGKENAQGTAIAAATGEILVFSDVATEIPPDALRRIAAGFAADPGVGAISSEDRFISRNGEIAGEGAYVRYEMWLRKLESERAGLVGLSGSFFAARRAVCAAWDIHAPSDFNTALNCARLGRCAISHPEVLGFYEDVQDPSREYLRKVRTVLRGITAIARHPNVLSPAFGTFALQVWSHKLMRWLVPWFLLALLPLNALLLGTHWLYALAALAQLGFYGVAVAGHLSPRLRHLLPVRIIYFFVQVNLAIADATLQFLRGQRMTVWSPTVR